MQIVIDISENVIESAKSSPNYYPYYHYEKIWRAIGNGTPLDKVLGDIKTEIEECWQMYEDRYDVGDCLDIIDKHISGKESK